MAKTIEHAAEAIQSIKQLYRVEVIKDYQMPPLVNTNTGETIGFAVVLQLSTKYDYDEEMLIMWKEMLDADDWCLRAKRNQLHITFRIRHKK